MALYFHVAPTAGSGVVSVVFDLEQHKVIAVAAVSGGHKIISRHSI